MSERPQCPEFSIRVWVVTAMAWIECKEVTKVEGKRASVQIFDNGALKTVQVSTGDILISEAHVIGKKLDASYLKDKNFGYRGYVPLFRHRKGTIIPRIADFEDCIRRRNL